LWLLELVLVSALSGVFYPARTRRRVFFDVLKMLALCAFLAAFLIALYLGARGKVGLEPAAVLLSVGLLVLRMAMIARDAKAEKNPALAWADAALMRAAALLIGLFLGVFACLLPGLYVVGALHYVLPTVAADLGLGMVLLAIQVGLVAVLSTMSEAELRQIAGNPYLS